MPVGGWGAFGALSQVHAPTAQSQGHHNFRRQELEADLYFSLLIANFLHQIKLINESGDRVRSSLQAFGSLYVFRTPICQYCQ